MKQRRARDRFIQLLCIEDGGLMQSGLG